jgi:hypothetical protein
LLSTQEPFKNTQSVATGERLTICATKTVTTKYLPVIVEAAGRVKVIAPEAQVFVRFFSAIVFVTVAVEACAETAKPDVIGAQSIANIQDVFVQILT